MREPREVRRVYAGSTYWIRRRGTNWVVTADGVAIAGPTTFATALENLNAVAPKETT